MQMRNGRGAEEADLEVQSRHWWMPLALSPGSIKSFWCVFAFVTHVSRSDPMSCLISPVSSSSIFIVPHLTLMTFSFS